MLVYTNDHAPAHVHVLKGSARVKVGLLPELAYVSHVGSITNAQIRRAVRIVGENLAQCLEAWSKYHG